MVQTRKSFLKLAGAAGIAAVNAAAEQMKQTSSDRKDLPRQMTSCAVFKASIRSESERRKAVGIEEKATLRYP